VHPGLAIADAYRERLAGVEVLFLGSADGLETRLVPARGYRLELLPASPFLRVGWPGKMRAVVAMVAGALRARHVLRAQRVELVVGLGNYACAGAVVGAWSLGIPIVLHEANAVAGAANKVLAHLADRVLLGSLAARPAFRASKTLVTGVPLRAELLRLDAARAAPRVPAPGASVRVLVSGGSGGSPFLDAHVPELLARVVARGHAVEVRHHVAPGSAERTRAAYADAHIPAAVAPFVDDLADSYEWAHFAIVGGGAVTLAELAAVGLPALLVPLSSAARDHQSVNARSFADATGAWWTREEAWDADALATRLTSLIEAPGAWSAASTAVRRAARPDAAAAVVAACEAVLAQRSGFKSWASEGRGTRAP
jgi:UDP-N-acetylglucosamine--N-acetylmuramyl-(pentapeptide) pyrophosphoryl-undecaprenol N-acetylglucosamine transferase